MTLYTLFLLPWDHCLPWLPGGSPWGIHTVLYDLPQSRLVTYCQEVYTQCCLTYHSSDWSLTARRYTHSAAWLTTVQTGDLLPGGINTVLSGLPQSRLVTYYQEVYTQCCLTYHSPDWSLTARRYTHSAVWLGTVQTGHLLPGGIHTVLPDLPQSRLVTYYKEVYTQYCLTYHSSDWPPPVRHIVPGPDTQPAGAHTACCWHSGHVTSDILEKGTESFVLE